MPSPGNGASGIDTDGNLPPNKGGGQLDPVNVWDVPALSPADASAVIEAVATLTPAGVGDLIGRDSGKFKMKRDYNWKLWQNADLKEDASGTEESGDPALDLDPRDNDTLYDIDGPGHFAPDSDHTSEFYANFTQYVTYDCSPPRRISNQALWHYHGRTDYDKSNNNVELNEAGPGHIAPFPTAPHYQPR